MHQNLANWLSQPFLEGQATLISGAEECFPLQELLITRVSGLVDGAHLQSFSADRYFDISLIEDVLRSSSLFTEKNLLILVFKTKPTIEQQKKLISLYALLDENNYLIVSCDKLDKKDVASDWVKYYEKNGLVFNLNGDIGDASALINYRLAEHGFRIESDALKLLLDLNQGNLSQLNQEINKLSLLFNAPYSITAEDARQHLIDNSNYSIYSLSEAYLSGDLQLTLKIFNNVCVANEEVILMSWNIGEDLRKLIKIKNLQKTETNFRNIAGALRIWGNSIATFDKASKRLNYAQLISYFNDLARIDMAVKGVLQEDALTLLEKLVTDICIGRE